MSHRDNASRDRDEAARARDEAARLRDERSRDRDEAAEVARVERHKRTKSEGRLFTVQVVANIIFILVLSGMMLIALIRISDVQQQQLDSVKQQNDAQLCAQADIVGAVKQIGRSLGLPTQDIIPPDTTGIDCP